VKEFFVAGVPQPQGSKRHVGKGRMIEAAKGLGPWREAIIWEAKRRSPWSRGYANARNFEGPVWARFTFFFPRPKSHYGTGRNAGILKESAPMYHSSPPDVDKLVRAVGDALTMSGLIADDRLIVEILATKRYGEPPGVLIWLRDIEGVSSSQD
jgi:crossover junction endodeoxyribonuclease RusA